MPNHLLIAGVPATGKTMLGSWLSSAHGFLHVDLEKDNGIDLDVLDIHPGWNAIFQSGRADSFADALARIGKPVVLTWGFLVDHLFVVNALRVAGIIPVWLRGDRNHARRAYAARYLRGDPRHPANFDPQMDAIERHWLLIELVFKGHIVEGLTASGQQRTAEAIWADIRSGV